MTECWKDRQDYDLPFMLQFENIAWYQDGIVRVLDRRIYPIKTEFVECRHYQEVAAAIRDMITQSEGPYVAAAMGMVLAVHEVKEKNKREILEYAKEAAYSLSHARPTTSEQMTGIVKKSLSVIEDALTSGKTSDELVDSVMQFAFDYINNNYKRYTKIGRLMAKQIPDTGAILTHCFPGTVVGTMLRACKEQHKKIKVFCAETRPYFQGSRLTASVAFDMGFDVTVISDNMPAYTLKSQNIDMFITASDVITQDGHVINKIGTFQVAMAAHYFKIPYYVTGTPDLVHKDISNIIIEQRDPQMVTEAMGMKLTKKGVKGYYPAFDITPPEFVSGVVTDKGIFSADNLKEYFEV